MGLTLGTTGLRPHQNEFLVRQLRCRRAIRWIPSLWRSKARRIFSEFVASFIQSRCQRLHRFGPDLDRRSGEFHLVSCFGKRLNMRLEERGRGGKIELSAAIRLANSSANMAGSFFPRCLACDGENNCKEILRAMPDFPREEAVPVIVDLAFGHIESRNRYTGRGSAGPFVCAAAAKVSQCSLASGSFRCSSSEKRGPALAILASMGVVSGAMSIRLKWARLGVSCRQEGRGASPPSRIEDNLLLVQIDLEGSPSARHRDCVSVFPRQQHWPARPQQADPRPWLLGDDDIAAPADPCHRHRSTQRARPPARGKDIAG